MLLASVLSFNFQAILNLGWRGHTFSHTEELFKTPLTFTKKIMATCIWYKVAAMEMIGLQQRKTGDGIRVAKFYTQTHFTMYKT
jgi:hypothetical protein